MTEREGDTHTHAQKEMGNCNQLFLATDDNSGLAMMKIVVEVIMEDKSLG